jgi:hypothetical protein
MHIGFWWESQKERDKLDVDEHNIKIDRREKNGLLWAGFIYLRIRTGEHSCEHGKEALGSVYCWEILD